METLAGEPVDHSADLVGAPWRLNLDDQCCDGGMVVEQLDLFVQHWDIIIVSRGFVVVRF